MARPRKPKAEQPSTSNLLEAIRFTNLITKDQGAPFETHLNLSSGWVTAFNGIVSAGHKITEHIAACPQSKLMLEAVSKCGQNLSIELTPTQRLSVKSDKFRALVPCIDPAIMTYVTPDPPIALIDDRLKLALDTVGILANENGQKAYLASILINGYSTVGTTGSIVFEYWHGIHLPTGIAIPKTTVIVLSKVQKKLTRFGFSNSSATFYYEDDSWIKTQLYAEPWPDVLSSILDGPSNQWPIPVDLWKGLEAVAPFSDAGLVFFDAGSLRSHRETGVGASFDISGLPRGPIFQAKQLGLLKGLANTVDFFAPSPQAGTTMLKFHGPNIRGVIAGRTE